MRIVVGGLARKTGKTALVCRIIALTPWMNWTAVKISHHEAEAGAAYTLSEEMEVGESGDTRRYLAAGAAHAWWLRGDFDAALPELRGLLDAAENWIVESTRAVRALPHDYALLVVDPERMEDDKLLALLGHGGESSAP